MNVEGLSAARRGYTRLDRLSTQDVYRNCSERVGKRRSNDREPNLETSCEISACTNVIKGGRICLYVTCRGGRLPCMPAGANPIDIVAFALPATVSCWLPVDPPVKFVTLLFTCPVFGTDALLLLVAWALVSNSQLSGGRVTVCARVADAVANVAATAAMRIPFRRQL